MTVNKYLKMIGILLLIIGFGSVNLDYAQFSEFNPQKDLISLHYDHAPDRDDGHSAVADRVILQEQFGADWLPAHVVAVSGAYGTNGDQFRPESDAVMDAAWKNCCGWIDAHEDWKAAVRALYTRWTNVIDKGGSIWVKEGGQSDLTADVIRMIKAKNPGIDINRSIHVVQHSDWNEDQTTDNDLAYVKSTSDYIRISDANAYLNDRNGNPEFAKKALADPTYGSVWKVAFSYLDPDERVDFSDTGELLAILGIKINSVDGFADKYFDD